MDQTHKCNEQIIHGLKSRIQETDMLFEHIVEVATAGWWDWHIKENHEYLSPSFKMMFGYEDHEMDNSPESWQKIIHPDDLIVVLHHFDNHVKSKGDIPYRNIVRYYHKNGSIIWVNCSGKIIEWDQHDNPVRMVGTHVDITELKEVEQDLQNKVLELERINELIVERELRMIELKKEIALLKSTRPVLT